MKGYCMRCKKKVEMQDVVSKKTKKGSMFNRGKCPKCGTTVCCASKA
jgi:hypothetical protein